MKNNSLLSIALLSLLSVSANADNDITEIFKKQGIEGSLIIESLNGDTLYTHNLKRTETRFLPASTFKIPNTLIALEENFIGSHNDVFKWDGEDKGYPAWNKNQTLASAFRVSCIWCYQELAIKTGNAKYLSYLESLNYGNKKTGKELTTFWLDGELKISVKEQVSFLRKVYLQQLPFKKQNFKILKDIMLVEKNNRYQLYAKTGWANRIKNQHGWYVGYIITNSKVWLFANNIAIRSTADLKLRKQLLMESLAKKDII